MPNNSRQPIAPHCSYGHIDQVNVAVPTTRVGLLTPKPPPEVEIAIGVPHRSNLRAVANLQRLLDRSRFRAARWRAQAPHIRHLGNLFYHSCRFVLCAHSGKRLPHAGNSPLPI